MKQPFQNFITKSDLKHEFRGKFDNFSFYYGFHRLNSMVPHTIVCIEIRSI